MLLKLFVIFFFFMIYKYILLIDKANSRGKNIFDNTEVIMQKLLKVGINLFTLTKLFKI